MSIPSAPRRIPAFLASYYGSAPAFERRVEVKLGQLTPEQRGLLSAWVDIGRRNPWISNAFDPPFSELMIEFCADTRALVERILEGNWCVGQGFALGDLCFLNQVDGGGEWLTIKGDLAFESITMPCHSAGEGVQEGEAFKMIHALQVATLEQCRRLEWMEPYQITEDYVLHSNLSNEVAVPAPNQNSSAHSLFEYVYRDRTGAHDRFQKLVDATPDRLLFVVGNSISRYLVSLDDGQLSVEQVAGVSNVQRWVFPIAELARIAGSDFLLRDRLDLFSCLLPYLRPQSAFLRSYSR